TCCRRNDVSFVASWSVSNPDAGTCPIGRSMGGYDSYRERSASSKAPCCCNFQYGLLQSIRQSYWSETDLCNSDSRYLSCEATQLIFFEHGHAESTWWINHRNGYCIVLWSSSEIATPSHIGCSRAGACRHDDCDWGC